MSDVDRFLARVVPWPSASLQGYVNIHWPFKGGQRPAMPGRAFQQFQSCVGFVNGMMRNPVDVYVCLSLQTTTKPPTMKAGREKRAAIRAELNATHYRAIWIDVDIKNGEYRDTQHALTEFGIWRRKVNLPLPTLVVLTGSGGFHAYWCFDEPITKAVWEPLAYALAEAMRKEGYKADLKLTTNPVALMRIPGTFNQKWNPPRLATLVHEGYDYPLSALDGPLTPYKVTYSVPTARVTPARNLGLGKPSAVFAGVALPPGRLDSNVDVYVPTLEDVIDGGCDFLKNTKATHGAHHAEPLWFESLKVCYYLDQGEEVAHELSDGHPTYSERETDEKYAEVVRSHAGQRIGWPQCRTIHDAGAQECRTCPHLQAGRSPLNFAIPKAVVAVAAAAAIASTTPVVPTAAAPVVMTQQFIPVGFGQYPNRHIFKWVENPDGPDKPAVPQVILPLPLFNIVAYDKAEEGGSYSVAFNCEIMPTKVRYIELTYSELMDSRKLPDRLGQQGLAVDHLQARLLKELMVAFVQQLKDAKARVVFDCAPYGWSKNAAGKEDAFCYAHRRWNGNGSDPVKPLDREIDTDYTPRGDFAIWKDAAKLITDQKRPELNAVIGASIGAPLMVFTGHNGCVLHPWSPESGTGKSATLCVSQSVWGTTAKMSQLGDTPNALNARLGALRNLPVVYDEMKKSDDRKLLDLIMQIAQGKTKARLTRSSQMAEVFTWHTLMITASNSPLHDYIAEHDASTVAGINRVFEYRVHHNRNGLGLIDHTKAQRLIGELQSNYGHAGLEIAKYLGANADKVRDAVARASDSINKSVGGTTDDRFWIAMMAVSLVGAKMGKDLGFVDIDLDQLAGFMVEQLQEQRGERGASSSNLTNRDTVIRHLANFITAHADQMLLTDTVWMGGKRPAGWRSVVSTLPERTKIVIRGAKGDNQLILSLKALGNWTKKEHGLNRSQIERAVKETIQAAKVGTKAELGHGTQFKLPREDVIWLDLNQMPGFFNFD